MRRFYKDPDNRNVTKKAFNVGFHPTFLYIFPNAWIYSLPFNFIVDSIVLLIGFKIFGKEKVWHNWKKSILLSWIFGYLSDHSGLIGKYGKQLQIQIREMSSS